MTHPQPMSTGDEHRLPAPIAPLRLTAYSVCSAIGRGRRETACALRERRSGLTPNDFGPAPVPTWIGRVPGIESEPLPGHLARWDCRNSRLAWLGLNQDGFLDAVVRARARFGSGRIAVILGTSTSSINATEEAYRHLDAQRRFPPELRRPQVHTPHSTGDFVQHALALTGPCVTVATACSSSAKAFAQAERMLRLGLADAAVVGGVDSLCDSVLFGFNALELVSPEPCRPFDAARRGINLGEAAGFALLERGLGPGPALLGYGESSDAHHMSSPHPEGLGARLAVRDALSRAGVAADRIDYINLHGTASQKNDEIEARLIADLFPARTIASSTKGWTAHTLGAAGMLEAAITLLALESGHAPGTLNSGTLDTACGPQIRIENRDADLRLALSLSFGFGGSNCVLVFAREGCA
jgi:3-oxoacyl-[acyl-carrier-protein] synthase-1